MPDRLTLIVGTTSDYIDIISKRMPGQTLFLTDIQERKKAKELPPPDNYELLCRLESFDETLEHLNQHLDKNKFLLNGIACFDCESMHLTAKIAEALSLNYPAPDAILNCRSKFACKEQWRNSSLPCPGAWRTKNLDEARALIPGLKFPVVLKPLSGSGSEYVFKCADSREYLDCLNIIESGISRLRDDPGKPLYSRDHASSEMPFACAIEEFIEGPEYSCDFVIDSDRIEIIRIARKIPEAGISFGTTLAYVVPSDLPALLDIGLFRRQLHAAARSLGLTRAICMLDFIVRNGQAVMIEMTPRPGGDCLPPLHLQSAGFDILDFAVKFASGGFPQVPPVSQWKQLVGLRLLAREPLTVTLFDTTELKKDKRVLEYHLKYEPGHRVVLPPEDYDSRVLGYVIFKPSDPGTIEQECGEISSLLQIASTN